MARGRRASRSPAPRVTISEQAGVRYLHFGTEWVQGAMRIARPFALELDYQKQMMAPLLFLPEPRRIVQLGLGAAALAKACWRALPQAQIVVVELSAEVVDAARQWFKLPDSERLAVTLEDAEAFVAHPRRRGSADWLQVDLYDAAARGPVCDSVEFYRHCRGLLAAPGVAAINLFGRGFEPSFARIAAAFDDRAIVLPEAEAGNRIVLAFTGARLELTFAQLYERAADLERCFRWPARRWVSGIKSCNGFEHDFVL
jgi:spermidine synthase